MHWEQYAKIFFIRQRVLDYLLNIFTMLTTIVAIETADELIVTTSAVDNFFFRLFAGTTISMPGLISLLDNFDIFFTPPFIYMAYAPFFFDLSA